MYELSNYSLAVDILLAKQWQKQNHTSSLQCKSLSFDNSNKEKNKQTITKKNTQPPPQQKKTTTQHLFSVTQEEYFKCCISSMSHFTWKINLTVALGNSVPKDRWYSWFTKSGNSVCNVSSSPLGLRHGRNYMKYFVIRLVIWHC